MAWTEPEYSKTTVDRAGYKLFSESFFEPTDSLEVLDNWRSAHNFPLHIFQDGLRKRSKLIDNGCIVAQRIKRLSSITAKLRRYPKMRLSMMQDIGGCRSVFKTVEQVYTLVESYQKSRIKHTLHQKDDYIKNPKESGYRGIHLVYRYFSDRKPTFNGLKIEIQIRTTRQHAWATAVETIGTFINQALKSSSGHDDWLRFFALMASAIAVMEKQPTVPGTPSDPAVLKNELTLYAKKLDVESYLSAFTKAVATITSRKDSHYFLLVLDPDKRVINVKGYPAGMLQLASARYSAVEKEIRDSNKDAVLVSASSVNALRSAFPNYFLDTGSFLQLLKRAIE